MKRTCRLIESHDQRLGARSFAEESHAAEQSSGVTPVQAKMIFLPGARSCRIVNALRILDAHLRQPLVVFGFRSHEAAENLAVQAAQRRSGEHAFWRAPRAHHGVNAHVRNRRADSRRKIAIGNQPNARAGLANILRSASRGAGGRARS